MFVVIVLFLVALILLGSHLAGWIDNEFLQGLGWIITIVTGIGAILQFVFPLATTFDPNFSFELPEGITVEGAATILPTPTELAEVPPAAQPTSPPTAQPSNEPVPSAPEPTATLIAPNRSAD